MKAIDYIRKGWTQGNYARNVTGSECDYDSLEATCWCAMGAIRAAYRVNFEGITALNCLLKIISAPHNYNIVDWNDSPNRTHAEVIEAFEKAGI
jgi:hypothetical protein